MCAICGSMPCRTGCPNEVRKPVHICQNCGQGIFEREEYMKIEGRYFCEDCLKNDMTGFDVAEMFGCYLTAAEKEDDFWEDFDRE